MKIAVLLLAPALFAQSGIVHPDGSCRPYGAFCTLNAEDNPADFFWKFQGKEYAISAAARRMLKYDPPTGHVSWPSYGKQEWSAVIPEEYRRSFENFLWGVKRSK